NGGRPGEPGGSDPDGDPLGRQTVGEILNKEVIELAAKDIAVRARVLPSCNLISDQCARLGRPVDGQKRLGFAGPLWKRSDLYRILAERGRGGSCGVIGACSA